MFKLSWQLSLVTVIGLPVIMVVSEAYGEYYKVQLNHYFKKCLHAAFFSRFLITQRFLFIIVVNGDGVTNGQNG